MANKPSSITSSQARGTPLKVTVIKDFEPLNVKMESKSLARRDLATAGKSTRNIEKSTSQTMSGPKTNNL